MKRLIITEEEKQRILQMHESAIKKNYLIKEENTPTLKIDSIQSANYTTCNPQKQSNWVKIKQEIDGKPKLKGINWETIFKESSIGSRFGIQNGLIWEFKQKTLDSVLLNLYNFYYLSNSGNLKSFAAVEYSCSTGWRITKYSEPAIETERGNLLPIAIMGALTNNYSSDYGGEIQNDIVIKLLNLIKSQPNLNPTVASAIKAATEGKLRTEGPYDEDFLKMVKNQDRYKSLGGV